LIAWKRGCWRGWLRASGVEAERTTLIVPTAMASTLADTLAAAASAAGQEPVRMPSGAGHDAMMLARFLPAAMPVSLPSIGGRSHHVSENTADADIVLAARCWPTPWRGCVRFPLGRRSAENRVEQA